jgi:hypothetical protein
MNDGSVSLWQASAPADRLAQQIQGKTETIGGR